MQPDRPNRREVIALLGTAAAWPQPARAQQRLIGVLSGAAESDPQARAQQDAFVQALSERGWVNGRNVQVETRWRRGCWPHARRC